MLRVTRATLGYSIISHFYPCDLSLPSFTLVTSFKIIYLSHSIYFLLYFYLGNASVLGASTSSLQTFIIFGLGFYFLRFKNLSCLHFILYIFVSYIYLFTCLIYCRCIYLHPYSLHFFGDNFRLTGEL